MNAPIKDEPKVISRPWDGSHPPPAPETPATTAADLGAIVLAGIKAHRFLPEAGSVSAAENARLEQGANDRIDAKIALERLVEMAKRAPVVESEP